LITSTVNILASSAPRGGINKHFEKQGRNKLFMEKKMKIDKHF